MAQICILVYGIIFSTLSSSPPLMMISRTRKNRVSTEELLQEKYFAEFMWKRHATEGEHHMRFR